MTSQSVIFINSFGDHGTFPHNLTASTQSQRSATANFFDVSSVKSKDLLLCNAIDKEIRNMSVAFREVFKEFNVNSSRPTPAGDTGSPSVAARFHKFPDVFGLDDQLLVSNDNIRPRSRAKTSITSYDIHKVSPCGSDWQQQKFGSESPSIHKHYIDDFSSRAHKDVLSPIPSKELNNESNNAQDNMDLKLDLVKRGKRPKKKTTFNNKARKGKHGRIFSTSTGLQEKRVIVASQHSVASSADKPQKPRISSEPPSKVSQNSVISYTLLDNGCGSTQKHVSNTTATNVQVHNMYPLRVSSAKTNSSSLPTTHYVHGNITCNPILNNLASVHGLEAQGQPVQIHKLDLNARVRSASSLKSESSSQLLSVKTGATEQAGDTDELALNAVSCNLQRQDKPSKAGTKHQSIHLNHGLSAENAVKEAVLTSIYGAVYQTADKVSAQAEELKKVKKIFLSEKQSGTLRESGMEFPCAPPATPNPDLLKKHEFVPSMSDIRSQRAVKSRLQTMEKEAQKKQEKKREAQVRLEKQQSKDREKMIKAKQRREIYALNKIMTELENKRFLDFCQAKGLNKV